MDVVWRDLVFAWRSVLRRPAITSLAVMTLALGVGANSAVFTLLDAVLLRPPAYPQSDRLVFVWQTLPRMGVMELETTPADFRDWQGLGDTFASIALVATDSFAITGDGDPERVRGARVSAGLFPTLGVQPQIGRVFSDAEDVAGNGFVVVLSDGLWRRRYAARADLVGRSIEIDGRPHTIVGVMPASFRLPDPLASSDQLWVPAALTAAQWNNRISHNYTAVARLRDGVSIDAANAAVGAWAERAAAGRSGNTVAGARVVAIRAQAVKNVRATLLTLLGAVALVLLIACSNVANLFLARVAGRQRELAVRAALGATRLRLAVLLLCESVLVALAGGIAGLMLGRWALHALWPIVGATLPSNASTTITLQVVAFTLGAALLAGLASGGLSAAQALRRTARSDGTFNDRTGGTGPRRRTRAALVVSQIALATMLLAAAGVLIRSLVQLSRVNPGYSVEHVLTFRMALPDIAYASSEQRMSFVRRFIAEIAALPGVDKAGATSRLPLGGTRGATVVSIEGRAPATPGEQLIIDQREVTPDYFAVMRIRLLAGRAFDERDDERAAGVAIVNRTMAIRYWPGDSPVGKRVALPLGTERTSWLTVVGVVDDVKHTAIRGNPVPEMYRPLAQRPKPELVFAVRGPEDPISILPAIRERAKAIDSRLPLFDVQTMRERVESSTSDTRVWTLLLGLLAGLALALAAVGVYGSLWCSVAERTRELGVRVALGAGRRAIFGLVLGEACLLTVTGLGIGLAGTIATTRMLASLLFDTTPTDPLTLAATMGALLALGLLAAAIPAARAMRVDPVIALRTD